MSFNIMLHSFVGGIWSPSLYGRTDLEKYPTALRQAMNCYPHQYGGMSNRPGLEFIGETKDSTKVTRKIPFQFSTVQSYVLEFGDQYMRVIKDGGYVVMTLATTSAWVTSTGYVAGNFVKESNKIYYCLSAHTSGTFATDLSAGRWIEQSIYEIPTPYLEADLALIKYEQSADVLYLWHPTYSERKLSRTGHTTWTLTTVSFAPSISAPTSLARSSGSGSGKTYVVTAVTVDGEESVASSSVSGGRGDTFTWTAVSGADHYDFYEGENGVHYYIGQAATNSYTVPTTPSLDYELTPPKATNPFNGAGNYPGCGSFHDQRLVRARTNNKPSSLFGSVIGSFENMNVSSPLRDDDAYTLALYAKRVNEIKWMVSLERLIIGTSDSEWKLAPGNNSNTITPTDAPNLKCQSRYGSSDIPPLIIGQTVLFVEADGKVVRDFIYNIQIDGYEGTDLSLMANHLFKARKIVAWAYQQHPDTIIWCVMDDGSLCGLTYNRDQKVWAWHEHETDGDFEDVCCITTAAGVDEVYFTVKRTIGTTDKRLTERLSERESDSIVDAFFVDCGLTYSGAAATTISGLDHLEGETVVALADGNVVENLTVSSGSITLPHAAEKVHVGLPYTWYFETMEIEYQGRNGSVQGSLRDADSVTLRLENTREIFVGSDADHLEEVKFRTTEDYGDAIEPFTGDKTDILVPSGDERHNRLYLTGSSPVPATVLAIIARVSNGE